MAMMTIRNIPDEVYRALRVRATEHGLSAEAEVRSILEKTVRGQSRVQLGTMLAEIGQQACLTDEEFAQFSQVRDKDAATPVDFE